ncbi:MULTISPECIES: prolyl oligopeptidase family serine peptidase [unclassified Colwellia]|uniref:S9 family peptidase n=1 Tax=unclassified Colwellia TaxID=196834 RepID=UPI0015F3A281|nr:MULTISPECIES: prolyl oligopeptidase family serine peptidase [unclassified Colwellia]MBA6357738.1 S9 family peptidase [Colwellia sp. BRX8-3]MBA6361539.1 S9 family peptidase [Colwellia sp. BRX8-6]MBA6369661.1 S9 family peptidase [Colwellia sp. BRX8-5]MBA6373422.1 S9 family peptidase [Colwellia sp. BRX8-4]MBA6376683.1 S9 family peptidase [Colwellia sp. BRX8-2]
MKIKILTAAISLSLVACVTTTADQSAENILDDNYSNKSVAVAKEVKTIAIAKAVAPKESTSANNDLLITLEQIMSDPDWMGRSPQSWYWGDDNQTIFYKQKRAGSPLSDLYRQATLDKEAEKVKLAQMHVVSDRNAQRNKANTHEVYTFEGNVFVKELASLDVQQLTYTSAYEYSTMFLNNGNVAYRVGNKFFEHDLSSNKIIELANLQLKKDPKDSEESQSYIASEQHDLIAYVALKKRNSELRKNQQEKLKAQNATLTKSDFYLGDNKRINHASLSPNGDKLIVSISSGESSQADSDIMPNYIADDGHIKAEKVRQRVADNRQYNDELFLLDLKSGQQFPLSYDVLPGADEDVLASVKTENYQREGKVYQSQKSPRNIHVMQANSPIQWHENGKQVAVLLEAWDNKDRWLTTVNLMENKLESQHRLHDDAWINWSFNEFGWLKGDNTLYYLSEETGYSHLYSKNLAGKAKQLTRGQFEISDVSLTQDKSRFVFKANKKHPGIYEIYQVDIKSGQFSALTDLGGMNDYALSPDDSTLLIEHSTVAMPPELYVKALKDDATAIRLTHTVSEKFLSMPWTAPSVVAVPSSYQDEPVYSRVYLPKDYDKTADKNRAVMFSHGAGYLQNSHLGWSGYFREYMFHSMLVQQGYVVIDMDYRASAGYGRDWRTAIYRHMGKPEVQDMRDGVNWLVDNANVDRQRIGTYGGSYGGFLTLMSMFTQPDLFQSGSALRLVSDWAYYNHGYTSNILNTPGDDAIAYERSSPIYFAEGLEKPLLINAPMVDDNVFFQDTVRLVQRLIELEKQNFETAIYPVEPHGFVQPSSWLNEYRRIYKLFENTL